MTYLRVKKISIYGMCDGEKVIGGVLGESDSIWIMGGSWPRSLYFILGEMRSL